MFQSRILIQRNDPIFEEDKDQNWKHEYGGKLFFHVDWNVLLLKPKMQTKLLGFRSASHKHDFFRFCRFISLLNNYSGSKATNFPSHLWVLFQLWCKANTFQAISKVNRIGTFLTCLKFFLFPALGAPHIPPHGWHGILPSPSGMSLGSLCWYHSSKDGILQYEHGLI